MPCSWTSISRTRCPKHPKSKHPKFKHPISKNFISKNSISKNSISKEHGMKKRTQDDGLKREGRMKRDGMAEPSPGADFQQIRPGGAAL
jgi:hypothetical protein